MHFSFEGHRLGAGHLESILKSTSLFNLNGWESHKSNCHQLVCTGFSILQNNPFFAPTSPTLSPKQDCLMASAKGIYLGDNICLVGTKNEVHQPCIECIYDTIFLQACEDKFNSSGRAVYSGILKGYQAKGQAIYDVICFIESHRDVQAYLNPFNANQSEIAIRIRAWHLTNPKSSKLLYVNRVGLSGCVSKPATSLVRIWGQSLSLMDGEYGVPVCVSLQNGCRGFGLSPFILKYPSVRFARLAKPSLFWINTGRLLFSKSWTNADI